jgi:hypothetical protein
LFFLTAGRKAGQEAREGQKSRRIGDMHASVSSREHGCPPGALLLTDLFHWFLGSTQEAALLPFPRQLLCHLLLSIGCCSSRLGCWVPMHTSYLETLTATGLQDLLGLRHFSQITTVTKQSLDVHTQCAVWIAARLFWLTSEKREDSGTRCTEFKSQLLFFIVCEFFMSF